MLAIHEASKLSHIELQRLLERVSSQDTEAYQIVQTILDDVEREGLPAVQRYTEQLDGAKLENFIVTEDEYIQAENALNDQLKEAFLHAKENITSFHMLQNEGLQDKETVVAGTRIGFRYLPVEIAGLYVPGGLANYPSSVLMGVIPAKIAGVKDFLIITPPSPDGKVDPAVLYCAKLTGASAILKVGGAQGIGAATFGLFFRPVGILVGPGNRYVTAAKLILGAQGRLRMESPAGPSEIVVIADETARPDFVAADLLSQAEHGPDSVAVLLCCSKTFAEQVSREIEQGIMKRPTRREMKQKSIQEHSFALVFDNWEGVYGFANDYAPEHLELCVQDPEMALHKIKNAGSIFLGHYAPVALGDYYSGTNHILPTGGAARFYSGLGVDSFLKKITYQYPSKESLKNATEAILAMSRQEGLEHEHGHSVCIRLSD